MQRIRSIALVAAFSILAGCGGGGGVAGPGGGGGGGGGGGNNCPTNNICMTAGSFSPATLTVTKGTTVTFNNTSSTEHTVVFDAVPEPVANIGSMPAAATATRTFGTAGTYLFHCTIHAGMSGSVVAQ